MTVTFRIPPSPFFMRRTYSGAFDSGMRSLMIPSILTVLLRMRSIAWKVFLIDVKLEMIWIFAHDAEVIQANLAVEVRDAEDQHLPRARTKRLAVALTSIPTPVASEHALVVFSGTRQTGEHLAQASLAA